MTSRGAWNMHFRSHVLSVTAGQRIPELSIYEWSTVYFSTEAEITELNLFSFNKSKLSQIFCSERFDLSLKTEEKEHTAPLFNNLRTQGVRKRRKFLEFIPSKAVLNVDSGGRLGVK